MLVRDECCTGHTISALTRDPRKITPRGGLTVRKGTPYNKNDIETSFTQGGTPSAVLVTLSTLASDNPFAKSSAPSDTLTTSNGDAIQVMKSYGVKKLIVMEAQGVGDRFVGLGFFTRLFLRYSPMGAQFRNHDRTDEMIRREGQNGALQWVIARPCMLKGKEKLPVKAMGGTGTGTGIMSSCSRGSVSSSMLDAADSTKRNCQSPVIMN